MWNKGKRSQGDYHTELMYRYTLEHYKIGSESEVEEAKHKERERERRWSGEKERGLKKVRSDALER